MFNEIMTILNKKQMRRSIRFSFILQKIGEILKISIQTKPIKTENTRKKYNEIWNKEVAPRLLG